jgi:adenine-specific DNA methylase
MKEKSSQSEEAQPQEKNLKINDQLPIRTVGIETERERKDFTHLPPQNYLHVWWARRPTAASRLAVLASVLPDSVGNDELLKWMQIDPDNITEGYSVDEWVRKRRETADDRDGAEYEHYGYRKIWRKTPDTDQKNDIHANARQYWDGELPTVLDATAGGGAIPFESVRYGLPTIANELNPVASAILEGVLVHPTIDSDLSEDIEQWGEEINDRAKYKLDDYFSSKDDKQALAYLWSHTITCPDCGLELPLAPNWWLEKESGSEGIAARPSIDSNDDSVNFDVVELPTEVEKSEYNPTEGTVSYGKATCLRCDVTVGGDEIKQQAQDDGFGYQVYTVYNNSLAKGEGRGFRSPTEDDTEAFEAACDEVQTNPELVSFLDQEVPSGSKTDELRRYGINKWRQLYSPRQLLTHHKYLESYKEVKPKIREEYSEKESAAILTYLAFAADKALTMNCRQSWWEPSTPKIAQIFDRHDFGFKWSFAENNLLAQDLGYEWVLGNILTSYDDLRDLSKGGGKAGVHQGDAASLSLDDGSVEAVVLDPPYYDNVMYSELSDFFYVMINDYLGDVYPNSFTSDLANKNEEAVANPAKFEGIAGDSKSKSELAKQEYETKMSDIFEEVSRVLDDDGVFTLMFTHKRTEAWDTLTTALINAGFVVKATHPVNTESQVSLHIRGNNSAESTILLASEKRATTEDQELTLWDDIQKKTRSVAEQRAKNLDQREIGLTKVDIILASFGPTLEVFTSNYPVVDDQDEKVPPEVALDEARDAVRDYFIDQYLNEGVKEVDPVTEWYILAWLVFEAERFPYDEARRLAIGLGQELDDLKREHRLWRKRSGNVLLRPHEDRVQNIKKDPDARSGRKPVNPDSLSFSTTLDKLHAAIHVYDALGESRAWNWMNDRNCGSDPSFKSTVAALLKVMPQSHKDWATLRDLVVGETGELLEIDLDASLFEEENQNNQQQRLTDRY